MGLFDLFLDKKKDINLEVSDDAVVAVCTGDFIPAEKISDPVFSGNMMGKTVAIEPTDGKIVSPVNGTLEVVFPTSHAFAVRTKAGTGYLIHIGIDTVSMNGEGFKALKKQGEYVKAGDTIIEVDLNKVKKANHPCTTMIIVTEPIENKEYNYIDFGFVNKGQIISK